MILEHHGRIERPFGVPPQARVRFSPPAKSSGKTIPAIISIPISAVLSLGVVSGVTWKNRARTHTLDVTPSVEAAFFPESNASPSLAPETTAPSEPASAPGGTKGAAGVHSAPEAPESSCEEST